MPQQQKKQYPQVVKCPPPDSAGFEAMVLYRLEKLEELVNPMVERMQRQMGAWEFAKLVGAFVLGAIAVATFFLRFVP